MFEQLRASLRTVMEGSTSPGDRRTALSDLKEALVHARLGVDDLRVGVEHARKRVEEARAELETIRRRKALAEKINDAETVSVAERFERLQSERVDVLERKLDAQERELALAEHEVGEMSGEFRRAVAGVRTKPDAPGATEAARDAARERAASAEVDALLDDDESLREQLDSQRRADSRARRDAEADERLAELKRRMGK